MIIPVVIAFIAVPITYYGVRIFRSWAAKRQLLDIPNERSSHTRPTPVGGGIVIVLVTLLGGGALAVADFRHLGTPYFWYASGAMMIAAISWLDDLRPLPSALRLGIHLAAAVTAIWGLGYWTSLALPFLGVIDVGLWGILITVAWIVGLTNAYNFMDGTDGIAGAQALVGGLGWASLGWVFGEPIVCGLGFLLAGASLGFLVHNWPPASIFMGDVGSAFLGYTLAVLPVMFGYFSRSSPGAPIVGLLLVWPFVFDTAFTFLRRLGRRENVFAAHRSHLYQRMSTTTSGHARVALIYSGLAVGGMFLARTWSSEVVRGDTLNAVALPILCLGLWTCVLIYERRRTTA